MQYRPHISVNDDVIILRITLDDLLSAREPAKGRKRKLNGDQEQLLADLYELKTPIETLCKAFGITQATAYRIMERVSNKDVEIAASSN